MAMYEMRWMFNGAAIGAMTDRPQDREGPARELIEGFGGKLHHYYFMLGEYDGLGIVEFPDNTAAAACSMRASTSGAFARFETHALMTTQEAQRAMQMVKDRAFAYQAPNARA
ncbi:MAG TPA: GYD domain-containing protein [Acetobacteraceae bacterium]|nr:GYD domain-containing protein [Acetobacteraceae bacterium]